MNTTHTKPIFSQAQNAVFDWVSTGHGSAIVNSVAGSGKTTTLVGAVERMPGYVFVGMFNKRICDEAKAKADAFDIDMSNKRIGTFHSAGLSNWKYYLGRDMAQALQVDDAKVRSICEQLQIPEEYHQFICRMASFGKQYVIRPDVSWPGQWADIMDRFGVDSDLPDNVHPNDVAKYLMAVYRRSHDTCRQIIDFDDMLYAPLAYNIRMLQNDWVVIDEAQDTNVARRMLARRMLKKNGRLMAFGDRHQAIYQFTGADSNSMDLIGQEFNCAELYLDVSYRCPVKVVKYVQQWVRHIQPSPTAIDGLVRGPTLTTQPDGKSAPWFMSDRPNRTDAVLCRYTRPLVQTAYKMIKENIPCRVEGRDIGKNLIALCKRWKVRDLDTLEIKLDAYYKRELDKSVAKKRDGIRQSAEDRVDTIKVFIDKCRAAGKHSVNCVIESINELFADNVTGMTVLSTIHKAKGREWPRVYWLQMPDPQREMRDWEIESEVNCKYVAGTRAQQELVLVGGVR